MSPPKFYYNYLLLKTFL